MAEVAEQNVGQKSGLANLITLARIALIPLFMVFMLVQSLQPEGRYIAAAIFAVAAATDTLDGYVARLQKSITVFGQFIDPLADKILVSAALIALVELNRLSAWVALVIVAREFAVSGLRLVAAAERKIITASRLGKIKTFTQTLAVIAVILNLPGEFLGKSIGWHLMAVALLVTAVSGVDYFLKAGRSLNLWPAGKERS